MVAREEEEDVCTDGRLLAVAGVTLGERKMLLVERGFGLGGMSQGCCSESPPHWQGLLSEWSLRRTVSDGNDGRVVWRIWEGMVQRKLG